MNQRKKAETAPRAPEMKNAVSSMTNQRSQSAPIKGMVVPPKKTSGCPHARNAVNCCKT